MNQPTMTNYQRTAAWLNTCARQQGNPAHISTQIGVDAEEFAEWLSCLRVSQDGWAKVLERVTQDLNDLANAIKTGKIVAHIPEHMRVDALDALCDRDVTGNGCAYLLGFDKDAADHEVLRSNESKLQEDGTALISEGGKIMKSSRYSAPNLKGFV